MRYLKKITVMIAFLFTLQLTEGNYCAEKKDGIESFPQSYQPYLQELQKKYPEWKFSALYIDLDWDYVINNENIFGKNLVPKSYSDRWKNTKQGEYNVEVDSGWVDCSRIAVEYAMDPRNFLNEVRIFQFEGLSYDEITNNKEGIEKILYGTEFHNRIVEYVTSSGNTITMNSKYSDLILSAGKISQVSSYHLASRIKQEVGPFLSHNSISGRVSGFEGLYNFYNIGATSSTEPMGAIKNGLQYAKDGKGASQEIKNKYLIPWNSKERAITGGGIFIGSSYIHLGQDTLYLQKFHVSSKNNGELFWHQYMTNVLAPYSESNSIYKGYLSTGMLNNNITFIIPVYKNMPDMWTENPNILETDFSEDNTKVYADVSTTLNVRTGPSTSYEVLTRLDKNTIMTRIAKGKQKGELWDKVILDNGMKGYVFQSYLKEVPNKQIENINISLDNKIMKKGESQKIKIDITPEEAKDNEVEYSSDNNKVATVDSKGNILAMASGTATITVKAKENNVSSKTEVQVYTPLEDIQITNEDIVLQEEGKFTILPIIIPSDADNQKVKYISQDETIAIVDNDGNITALKEGNTIVIVQNEEETIKKEVKITVVKKLGKDEISFDESLRVNENEITGWNIKNMEASEIKKKINTKYMIKIFDSQNNELMDEQKAGTNCKIRIVDENNFIKMEYYIIVYGDLNGDGKINSIDSLVLQRHVLEIEKLRGVFLKAGNISKNGKNPSSLDGLIIQRHILGIELIEQ